MSIETTLTQTSSTDLLSLVLDCGNFERQELKAGKGNSPLVELALSHYAQPGILQLLETSQAVYREAALRWFSNGQREVESEKLWLDVETTTADYDQAYLGNNHAEIESKFDDCQRAYDAYSAFMRKDPAD